MLTSDLLRYSIDDRTITPRYLTRKKAPYYLGLAEAIINIYEAHIGCTRGQMEQALSEYENDSVSYKIQRGLAKVMDGCAIFNRPNEIDYPNYRKMFFEAVERYRPVVTQPDLVHQNTKSFVLEQIAQDLGTTTPNLYGDLPEHEVLKQLDRRISPEDLLRRYNLQLAQGILYRCTLMQIRVWDSFTTVFRYLKLAQLMHKIERDSQAFYIEVDGPVSLFQRTQKYGVNLARFLPGLLLARKWQMTAQVNTEQGLRYFYLNENCGLTSHYRNGNPFDSRLEEAFYKGFAKRKTDWQIERETEIIDLGDSVFIPDFKFIHPSGKHILLEIIGFWTPEYLSKKLEKIRRANRNDLIVAVNEKLNCSKADFSGPVIFIKTRLKTGAVLRELDRYLDHGIVESQDHHRRQDEEETLATG